MAHLGPSPWQVGAAAALETALGALLAVAVRVAVRRVRRRRG
jgi:hypothetical protein